MLTTPGSAEQSSVNGQFSDWRITSVTNPADKFEFCRSWVVTSRDGADPHSFTLEPLHSDTQCGLKLAIANAPKWVRVWERLPAVRPDAQLSATVRFRRTPYSPDRPVLDWVRIFHGNPGERPVVVQTLFESSDIEDAWNDVRSILQPDVFAPSRWLCLQFSGAGTIEIEHCRIEPLRPVERAIKLFATFGGSKSGIGRLLSRPGAGKPNGAAPVVLLAGPEPARAETSSPSIEVSTEPATSDAPTSSCRVVGLVNGHVVGWLVPQAPDVKVSLTVDRQRVAFAPRGNLSTADAKLLGNHLSHGFAIPVPPRFLDGKRHGVAVVREPSGELLSGETVELVFSAGVRTPKLGEVVSRAKVAGAVVKPPSRHTDTKVAVEAFLSNARFGDWTGASPNNWIVKPSSGTTPRKVASADSPLSLASLGNTVLSLDAAANSSVDGSVISQVIPPFKQTQAMVDVAILGSATERAELSIVLRQSKETGKSVQVAEPIVISPEWNLRIVRLIIPPDWHVNEKSEFQVVINGRAKRVQFALMTAGPAGFEPLEIKSLSAVEGLALNSVVNGDFSLWSGPLARTSTLRRFETADGWNLVSKVANPELQIRLTEIIPRGLKDGAQYKAVYGLTTFGAVTGAYVRLEAQLDPLRLLLSDPRHFSFFGRAASSMQPGTGLSQRKASMIPQIFVLEREVISLAPLDIKDRKIATVKRRVQLGSIGERFLFDIGGEDRKVLRQKAADVIRDPNRSLVLVFEFVESADCAIGNVWLGTDPHAPASVANEAIDFVGIEDENISAQLAYLKGIKDWDDPHPFAAPVMPDRLRPREIAKWGWLPKAQRSVDIVICVYNAVEETLDCLDSLRRHTTIPHTVTIVNDKSNEITREQLRRYVDQSPWMRLIENRENLGYTRSANVGMSSSWAEWICLLNSDTIVTPGWIEGMFDVIDSRPNVAMVGPLSNAASWQSVPDLHDAAGGWSVNPIPDGFSIDDVARIVSELSRRDFPEATLLNGFCTLMNRNVIEEVGFLDESAFPVGYGEENDLCVRVRKAGYSLAIADHIYVYHVKSASFGSGRRAELVKQGAARFIEKHPDVDLKITQQYLAEVTSLTELRKALRQKLVRAKMG